MNNFFYADKFVLYDKRLSEIDRIVYFALISIVDQNNEKCRYKYKDIHRLIGTSRSSIQRSIKRLKKIKLINKVRKTNGCEYSFNSDSIPNLNDLSVNSYCKFCKILN